MTQDLILPLVRSLYSPVKLGPYTFNNRLVMSPMTRSRALGNVPNDLMVEITSSGLRRLD